MQELTEDLSDVTNLLSSGTVDFDEADLEQELLQWSRNQKEPWKSFHKFQRTSRDQRGFLSRCKTCLYNLAGVSPNGIKSCSFCNFA